MKKKIQKGLYIIVDPAMDDFKILQQLYQIHTEQLAAVQIWDNPNAKISIRLIEEIVQLFKNTSTPILINNRWEYLQDYDLDGVHFDNLPTQIEEIAFQINKDFIKGITLTNNLEDLPRIEKMKFDYLSFCSLFPSTTSQSCELVAFDTLRHCKKKTKIPIFLSGGITPDNLQQLHSLNFEGIAIVSGIMNAAQPQKELKNYQQQLKNITYAT